MRRPLFMVCLCLVVIAGLLVGETDWSGLDGKTCIVTGRVYQKDNEYFYLNSINSIFLEHEAADQQQTISFSENLICEYDADTEMRLGSVVRVSGIFDAFSVATNPGEFHQAEYYHSLQIGGKLQKVAILEMSADYSEWRELLFQIREYFRERLYNIFPKKEASVMSAMLLGDKSDLDQEIKALYQENGIVHILSISGLHITIIGMSIYRMLRRLGVPVWVAAICGAGILLLYGVMTGMSVSACRAIGMYLLRMLSEVVGRTYDMLTALGVMAAIVVWNNPGYLTHAGFYLSFGAVLGIGVLYPALLQEKKEQEVLRYEANRWKQCIRKIGGAIISGLKQSMLSGLSVTLMTLPVQLWFYYEVPTYSVLINLLVIPFMNTVMICGLLAMLVPGLGILGTVDCLILGGYELLCNGFEKLPFHTWNPGRPEIWQMVIYYLLLLGVVAVRRVWDRYIHDSEQEHNVMRDGVNHSVDGTKRPVYSTKDSTDRTQFGLKGIVIVQILGLTIAVILLILRISNKTTITFLDVGQGDCICVQLESGEVYLFDCGSTSRSKVGEYVLKPYLKYYGITYIDAVFVSHPDVDHCNGVLELLQYGDEWGITVGQLVLPDLEAIQWSEDFAELHEGIKDTAGENEKELPVITIKAGDYWEVAGNRFLCLHPPENCTLQDSNTYSQCFYIELAGGVTVLLTGDVEAEGEEMLLAELERRDIEDITLLKVAHHGSKYSSGEVFLEQISPRVAIISCGENNVYGHPHGETLERLGEVGSQVFCTKNYGAITIQAGKEIEVYGYGK